MSMTLNQYCRQVSFQLFFRYELDDSQITSDLFWFRSYHEIRVVVSEGKVHLGVMVPPESS